MRPIASYPLSGLIALSFAFCVSLTGCKSPSGSAIVNRLGFSDSNIILFATVDNLALSPKNHLVKGIPHASLVGFWRCLDQATPANAPPTSPGYRLELLNGSSFERQKLDIFVSESGLTSIKRGDMTRAYFVNTNSLYSYADHAFKTSTNILQHSNANGADDIDNILRLLQHK